MLNTFRKKLAGTIEQKVDELQRRLALFMDDLLRQLNNMGSQDSWQVSEEDNVDASNSLEIDIYIPPNGKTRLISKVLLRVKLKAFRSYSAVTASDGSTTSGPSSASSSSSQTVASSGPSSASSSDSQVVASSGASSNETSSVESTDYGTIATLGFVITDNNTASHDHGAVTGSTSGADFSAHTHSISNYTGDSHSHDNYVHYHTLPHTHNITAHTHPIPHTHDITAHTHPIPHTHDVPAHTHNITAAITTGTTATGCTIVINGTDRTTALTGGATFSTDKDELDVTQYLTATGYNTISITSSGLGRIRATLFSSIYLNAR